LTLSTANLSRSADLPFAREIDAGYAGFRELAIHYRFRKNFLQSPASVALMCNDILKDLQR
jgi:hypothetical protein